MLQISVLKKKGLDIKEAVVLYNGVYRESLADFFKSCSVLYGFTYLKDINFDIQPRSLSVYDLFKKLVFNRCEIDKQIEDRFPILLSLRKIDVLITSIRVKMFSDIVLLSFLNPKRVVYTADGVIDFFPKRDFKRFNYLYLREYLKRFPIKEIVYSPFYLKNDVERIGVYKKIDCTPVFKEMLKLNLAKEFEYTFLKGKVGGVILSQHYHLHEGIAFEDDVNYYFQMIEFALKQDSEGVILFKPHPRDLNEKIERIKMFNNSRVLVVDDKFKALPIEVFSSYFKNDNTLFLTGNSSAPLYFKNTNRVISISSTIYLHKALRMRIQNFAHNYNIDYVEL
ncbi:polysialyltransferase family glycosyltransferase [Aequorivita sediminis]|uniref:polysialyltransferase family glycosyltransferase n=1 Tax=Aequorivita sediminis TaxID=3073653 RepID=UPI0028AFA199|nr:polysialyltransferase family glycosyltransferase [Aequorivita sp. F6058]